MAQTAGRSVQQSNAANAAATLIVSDEYLFNDVPTTNGKLMLRKASQLLAKNLRNGYDCKAACVTQDSPGAENHAGGVGNAIVQSEHANRERCGKEVLMSCVDPTSQLHTLLSTAAFALGSTVWTYLNGPNIVYLAPSTQEAADHTTTWKTKTRQDMPEDQHNEFLVLNFKSYLQGHNPSLHPTFNIA